MSTKHFAFLLSTVFFLLSSCATLLNHSSGRSTVEINSNPEGAEVYDEVGNFLGKTPLNIQIPKVSAYKITLKKEGYQPYMHTFQTGNKKGLLFLDAMLLCIPCIVDIPLHSFEQLLDPKLNSYLKKEAKAHSDTLFFSLWEPEFSLEKEELIGTYRGEKMYFKLNDYVLGSRKTIQNMLCQHSQDQPIRFRSCAQNNSSSVIDFMGSPLYALKPVVKKLHADIKQIRGKDYGKGQMEVDWQVIDMRSGQPMTKAFPVNCEFAGTLKVTRSLVDSLFMESYRLLLNDESVFEYLSTLSTPKTPVLKNNNLILSKPTLPIFDKTKDLVKHVSQAVVTVSHNEGFGSGFIISSDGFLITNYHVVKERKQVTVKLNSGVSLTANVLKTDQQADLALLKLAGNDFVAMVVGNSDSVELGEDVLAIGTPTSMQLGQTITKGIVSGKRMANDIVYIQTDVSINEGNSGGPLINEKGEVIGIITMKIIGEGIEGLGFCIPANKIFERFEISY
jgi:hypothetical protein